MAIDDLTTLSDGSGSGASRPGVAVDPFRVRRALLGGKWLLLGVGLAGLVVGFVYAKFVMSSLYESTAVLKFEGTLQIEGMPPPSRYALVAAADAMERQAILRRIADEVGFEGDLTTLGDYIDHEIDLRGGTVWITVPGDRPEDAAQFARTVIDVFIQFHEERQGERVEVEIGRINKRIAAAEAQADVARRRYNEFRDAHGIANLSTEQQSMLESAASLRAESELAVSEVRALEAQVKSLETQFATTPRTRVVSGDSPERAAYQQLRQELATARATLSESHPRVQALQQQVDQLGAQLRSGGTGTWGGDGQLAANTTHQAIGEQLREAKSDLEVLRERQRGLVELADKAQRRVEAFSDIEGEASALLSDVKVSETLVQGLRQTESALKDALRNPSSGFVILDPGSVPEYPERSKMKLVVFGAVPLISFGLALLWVLWGEFHGFRVQTPAEIAFWGGAPVLGATSWPSDPHGLDELVAGLDDCAPDARGSVLIVGGSPHETPLALQLADQMNNDWLITGGTPSGGPPPPQPIREPTPIQTPPPSGPYPVSRSTALATRPLIRPVEVLATRHVTERMKPEAWDGPFEGQALRRAARLADRVLVLVHSGTLSALQLNDTHRRLGRKGGIGYVIVGLPGELSSLPDRVGDVAQFWRVSA